MLLLMWTIKLAVNTAYVRVYHLPLNLYRVNNEPLGSTMFPIFEVSLIRSLTLYLKLFQLDYLLVNGPGHPNGAESCSVIIILPMSQ